MPRPPKPKSPPGTSDAPERRATKRGKSGSIKRRSALAAARDKVAATGVALGSAESRAADLAHRLEEAVKAHCATANLVAAEREKTAALDRKCDALARELAATRIALDAATEREAKVSHDLALAQAATEEAQRQALAHRATIDNYQRHCTDIQLAAIEMMIQFGKLAQNERARADHHHVATSLRDHLPF